MVHEKSAPISVEDIIKENRRFIVFQEPRFTVYGEFKAGELFLHCSPIKTWSKSTYIACLEAINIIKDKALENGFDHLFALVFLHKVKFLTMMGFTPIQIYVDQHERPLVLGVQHTDGSPVDVSS